MLAYIHDNGSPVKNIPRREFLRPGIQAGKAKIILRLGQGARLAVNGDIASIEKALTAAGLEAQKSVRAKITTGPFVKLKDATIAARRRKHKGRKSTNVSVTPLVDTGQLRNSINFVVVDKKK